MTSPMNLTPAEVRTILQNLHKLPKHKQTEVMEIITVLTERRRAEKRRSSLLEFVKHVDKNYKIGAHHKHLASLLEDMAFGRKDRVAVNIAPRFGKSQLTSIYFPAWFIGNFPDKKIMMISHTADLAVDFGRKVRNLVDSDAYKSVFPEVTLAADSKSAGRWNTNKGGEYFAVGVGGALAGRGADLMCIDDPHNEQDVLNGNFEVFDKAYDWYAYGARTRLMPGGCVALVMCMTGDTPVLMADGTAKRLDAIKVGDTIATYENGKVSTSTILNHRCSGSDPVFEIRTTCGIVVRANERHPFLVDRNGERIWTRLKYLKPGDSLVSLKAADAPLGPKQSPDYAEPASQKKRGTKNTQTRPTTQSATTVSGKGLFARLKGAMNQLMCEGVVSTTTTSIGGLLVQPLKLLKSVAPSASSIATGLRKKITTVCLQRKMAAAQCAANPPEIMSAPIGEESCALTMTTTQDKSGRSCVTTVTSRLGTEKRPTFSPKPLSTYVDSRAVIEAITPCGEELVYDVQVDRTENFIANGLVSHNTRWAQNDLTGRVVQDMVRNPDSDQWEVVEFPAILESEKEDPETGEITITKKSLWPEQWSLESLLRTKASMPPFQWNAQYMQQPTSAEAAIIKREWWQKWEDESPPPCDYIIMSLDAAAEKNNRADYTSLTTWGVFECDDENGLPQNNIILLNAIKERMEFPELKRRAYQELQEWKPDWFVVEKKSAGTALYQELRSAGIPVQEYTPHRGSGDKTARLNSVADIFASGMVWYPAGRRWAEEVVDEVCGFPAMPHDDHVDTTIMAVMRFRNGGFIRLPSDRYDDETFTPRRAAYY